MVSFLSDKELEVLQDKSFLLTKKEVSKKVIEHLAETEETLKTSLKTFEFPFPKGTRLKSGKISKGENYRDLPYFILDFPRLFSKDSVFAYRTMIWWGNEISCTLHLQGESWRKFRTHCEHPDSDDIFVCTGESPWEYHFEKDNYQISSKIEGDQWKVIFERSFFKISKKRPIHELASLKDFSLETLIEFLSFMR